MDQFMLFLKGVMEGAMYGLGIRCIVELSFDDFEKLGIEVALDEGLNCWTLV